MHEVDVDEREGSEKVGAVERLVRRLDGSYWNQEALVEVTEREVDADHGCKNWQVVTEVCVLFIAVVL